jgi:hypothetical protein
MRHIIPTALTTASVALAGSLFAQSDSPSIPEHYERALSAATVRQDSLANIAENSLLIGNGDINGLIHAKDGKLQLRITKNDVWDARLDTSRDPALATIDPATHKISGGGDPDSWKNPYPCPIACGVVELDSAKAGSSWRKERAEGKSNGWDFRDGRAVMSLEGKSGASCGWRTDLDCKDKMDKAVLKLSGTPNARFYLSVLGPDGRHVESGWQDAPAQEQDFAVNLPGGMTVSSIILYAWTKDGALAENRFASISLQGAAANLQFPLEKIAGQKADYRLDIRTAMVSLPGNSNATRIIVRAQADRNVFIIEGDTTLKLMPPTASFIPKAETGVRDGVEYVLQTLPPDPGYPDKGDWRGMSFAIAKTSANGCCAVAVVSSMESPQPLEAAVALAQSALKSDAVVLQNAHEQVWRSFWSVSQIDLADTYLRDVWYRNLYFMRCVSKDGVKPVGLYAGLVNDFPDWHGDFHLNYNSQQTYWGWYNCNHAELSQPYEWLIDQLLPRAQWLARQTYACNGAYFPHTAFMYEPRDPAQSKNKNGRQMAFIPYTYTLGLAGWAVQNHWLHYRHYPDLTLLRETVYPAVREAALFYAEFADKCKINAKTGKVVFGPTYSPEHWSLGRVDGTCDIAFARLALKAAIEGAQTMKTDAGLIARWQKTLEIIPDYPLFTHDDGSTVVVDVADAPPTCYNVPVPALPVYPAGEVNWFSPASVKELFVRTIGKMSSNGNNDMIILAGSRARLSMPDAYDWTRNQFECRQRANGTLSIAPRGGDFNGMGHFTEDFAASSVISEMLMQSAGGIIRVFPAWPKDKDAAFANLRAEGGFLVGAEQKAGKITKLEITSTVGGTLRVLNPWTEKIVEFTTTPNQTIEVTP